MAAKAPTTVDEFVEQKVPPQFREIVAAIRVLMRKHAPKATEAFSYGIPMYAEGKPLAWISASKTGITLGFRQGAYFEDKYGLLGDASKHSKNVKMKTAKDVNRAALRYYIKQAVELDKK